MKFAIIGSTFTGNKGAAAMLESSVQTLTEKYPDAQFTLLSVSPKVDKDMNPYPNVTVMNARPFRLGLLINPGAIVYKLLPPLRGLIAKFIPELKALHEADALLDEGGITFSDGREFYLIFNVATILPAMILGTKVIKVAQALGPFNNFINRTAAKLVLHRVHLIISRGDKTHEFLTELGLKNVKPGADYAFALEMTKEAETNAMKFIKSKNDIFSSKNKVVGISPSVVVKKQMDKTEADYMQLNKDFIASLQKQGYAIALVPHSVRLNTDKVHNNDLPLTKELYDSLDDKSNVLFVDEELTSQELRYVISQCDYFIASRFHAMVSSLAMAVPTMVVGWSHKYGEVLRMFEMKDYVLNYKEMTMDNLDRVFNEMVNDEKAIAKKFKENLPKVKARSHKNVEYIAEALT